MSAYDHDERPSLELLYRQLRLARRFDERALELRTAGRFDGVVHPAIGQEAVAVGVCSLLCDGDRITSTHRGHGHSLAKGADPKRMMAELFGRVDGYSHGKGGSMHIADFSVGMLGANGIVGAGMPIAMGAAVAAQLEGRGSIAVCFFSDGAAGAGPFHECMNIAALWHLPMVFVCENNGWASETPVEAALAAPPHKLAAGYGIASVAVDGNDVFSVMDAFDVAARRARSDEGPSLIEALTYRMTPHAVRSSMPAERRDSGTLDSWSARDPIQRFVDRVSSWPGAEVDFARIDREVEELLDRAIEYGEKSPYPPLESALTGLFA